MFVHSNQFNLVWTLHPNSSCPHINTHKLWKFSKLYCAQLLALLSLSQLTASQHIYTLKSHHIAHYTLQITYNLSHQTWKSTKTSANSNYFGWWISAKKCKKLKSWQIHTHCSKLTNSVDINWMLQFFWDFDCKITTK